MWIVRLALRRPYTFVVGWITEPSFVGQLNALDLTVTDTASTKAVALRPYSRGTPGMLLCNSVVVVQYMLPPTFCIVVPGVRSRGPKPLGANSRTIVGPPKKLLISGAC